MDGVCPGHGLRFTEKGQLSMTSVSLQMHGWNGSRPILSELMRSHVQETNQGDRHPRLPRQAASSHPFSMTLNKDDIFNLKVTLSNVS